MTEQEMMDWIDKATYKQLLSKWRFAPCGSPWFSSKVGAYFAAALKKSKETTPHDEQVQASRELGWE